MKQLVDVTFHSVLGQQLGKKSWKLSISSVGEAIHGINCLTNQKLYHFLRENDKKNIKYEILVNKRPCLVSDKVENSELVMENKDLKTIDIVPVLEVADSNIGAILGGIVLIAAGIFTFGSSAVLGAALIVGGLGLVAAGVINLLSPPPKFEDFREIQGGGRLSYLFNGPQQTIGEGGPVPIIYGELIVGSHVVSSSYRITEQTATEVLTT